MVRVIGTYLGLALGSLLVAMGIVCLTYGLVMIFGGDAGGLTGCGIGVVNLVLGFSRIREINDASEEA